MGQLGFSELIVIFVIALLVFGPKKLPELGKSLGKGLREFRRATDDLKANWDEQVREVEHAANEVKDDVKKDLSEPEKEVKAAESSSNGTRSQDPSPSKETSVDARQN